MTFSLPSYYRCSSSTGSCCNPEHPNSVSSVSISGDVDNCANWNSDFHIFPLRQYFPQSKQVFFFQFVSLFHSYSYVREVTLNLESIINCYVSVNSKPDHPTRAEPPGNFFDG